MCLTSFFSTKVATFSHDNLTRPAGRLMVGGLLLCIGVGSSVASWAQSATEESSLSTRLRVDRTMGALGVTGTSPQPLPYQQSQMPASMKTPPMGWVNGHAQPVFCYSVPVYVPTQQPMFAPPVQVYAPAQSAYMPPQQAPSAVPQPWHAQPNPPPLPPQGFLAGQPPYTPVQQPIGGIPQNFTSGQPHPFTPQPVQAPAVSAQGAWQVNLSDQTMSILLRRWAEEAGWQLVWEADRDFPIDSSFTLQGEFLGVLDSVMRSVQRSDYPLQALANPRTRVLRIVRYMDGRRN